MTSFFNQTSETIEALENAAINAFSNSNSATPFTPNELAEVIMKRNPSSSTSSSSMIELYEEAAKLCAETLLLFESKIEEENMKAAQNIQINNSNSETNDNASAAAASTDGDNVREVTMNSNVLSFSSGFKGLMWKHPPITGRSSFMSYDFLLSPPAMRPRG